MSQLRGWLAAPVGRMAWMVFLIFVSYVVMSSIVSSLRGGTIMDAAAYRIAAKTLEPYQTPDYVVTEVALRNVQRTLDVQIQQARALNVAATQTQQAFMEDPKYGLLEKNLIFFDTFEYDEIDGSQWDRLGTPLSVQNGAVITTSDQAVLQLRKQAITANSLMILAFDPGPLGTCRGSIELFGNTTSPLTLTFDDKINRINMAWLLNGVTTQKTYSVNGLSERCPILFVALEGDLVTLRFEGIDESFTRIRPKLYGSPLQMMWDSSLRFDSIAILDQ